MKRLDALVIDVDEADVIQVLQTKVRRIVVDAAALVAADRSEEALEGRAVEKVLAGMQLIADIDPELLVKVKYRSPAPRRSLRV